MIVGQQKDITRRPSIQKLRDGKSEGYRKRLMKMAEKFGIPVLRFRYPVLIHKAEEREQEKAMPEYI
jgi:acetyl-CoA carboxylase alpha subunit